MTVLHDDGGTRCSTARQFSKKAMTTSLLNKFGEINTLCDIQACAIIYTPNEPEAKKDVTLLADKNLEITKKNEILQVQEVTLAIENGGETKTEEKQALVANVDAMPNLNGLMTTMRMIGMGSM
ncbi:hypothetical protein D0Y65_030051 [Glycine soja]|uniref:Uncharacterized protein n=1 Tax=Glycine soja TaxID=3848 RepID=A0A445I237_GLYSO|nr:hypothetical protein D0Y65_030051 [Glycine soja]